MSAIAGMYYLDGRLIERGDLRRMDESLVHRGPDGGDLWSNDSAGLLHRMLWTTPESLLEKLPLRKQSADLVITADARLDNRDELFTTLDFSGRPHGEITDSELILAAYEKWYEQCPTKLLGDFVFAIWDGRKQTLFCARDHFGVKPFYYYYNGRVFIFASEIKALLCLSQVPRQLNEQRLGSYLASIINDTTATFYKDILRLSPAHSITVSHEGTSLRHYWAPDPSYEMRLGSDAEYAEAFREIFTESVRCRLRSAYPLGSMLSGGLDSSAVTCVARNLLDSNDKRPWSTFSAIYDKLAECDERPYINAVVAQNDIEPHFMYGDRIGPLTDLERIFWHQDEPCFAPHLFVRWGLYSIVNHQGVRIILDGFDGDTTVSHGFGYLHELASAGHWLSLATEIRGLAKTHGFSAGSLFRTFVWHYGLNPVVSGSRALSLMRRKWKVFFRKIQSGANQSTDHTAWSALLNPEFVRHAGLAEQYHSWRVAQPDSARTEREQHFRGIIQPIQPLGLEVMDRTAAAFSIEARYPFWDRRLVEFCLSLPPEQKLRGGWSRLVMRRAMSGILPAKVQWRRDKANFFPNFVHGLLNFEREHLDRLSLYDSEIVGEFVEVAKFQKAYGQFLSLGPRQNSVVVFAIWRVISLIFWLKNNFQVVATVSSGKKGGDAHALCKLN